MEAVFLASILNEMASGFHQFAIKDRNQHSISESV